MIHRAKDRGYCLEMIWADFLAGASIDGGNAEILLQCISRYYKLLPGPLPHNILAVCSSGTSALFTVPAVFISFARLPLGNSTGARGKPRKRGVATNPFLRRPL